MERAQTLLCANPAAVNLPLGVSLVPVTRDVQIFPSVSGGYRRVPCFGTSTLDRCVKFKPRLGLWDRATIWDRRGRIYSWWFKLEKTHLEL